MRTTLLTGWNFMRWVRLFLGIIVGIQALQSHDMLLGFMSVFLLFQTVTNTGCCGANGCAVPVSKKQSDKVEEVEFEEIK